MLADLEGEPLIVRTWRQAMHSTLAERVVVATDSREIASVLEERGAEVVMTSPLRAAEQSGLPRPHGALRVMCS